VALIQTPHRFRTKRQFWSYIGLALKTYTSGEYRFVGSQLQRSKKALAIRGLNHNHNHDLKNIFKGAAALAIATPGPFQNFYEACLAGERSPRWRVSHWRVRSHPLLCWFGRKECVSTLNI